MAASSNHVHDSDYSGGWPSGLVSSGPGTRRTSLASFARAPLVCPTRSLSSPGPSRLSHAMMITQASEDRDHLSERRRSRSARKDSELEGFE